MIFTLALAATALTLDGIALGDDAAKTAAAHAPVRTTVTALGPAWTWHRAGGGSVLLAGDAKGKVAAVMFLADPRETDAIDLPGASAFDVQNGYAKLQQRIGSPSSQCPPEYMAGYCAVFALADGTELVAQFEGPGQGQLHRATWADPEIIARLHDIPVTSP